MSNDPNAGITVDADDESTVDLTFESTCIEHGDTLRHVLRAEMETQLTNAIEAGEAVAARRLRRTLNSGAHFRRVAARAESQVMRSYAKAQAEGKVAANGDFMKYLLDWLKDGGFKMIMDFIFQIWGK